MAPNNQDTLRQLAKVAKTVEKAVIRRNIYLDQTFSKLEFFESEINKIAVQTGLDVDRVIQAANIKSPLQLLNDAITHWDRKLGISDLPSEAELVNRLTNEFHVQIQKIDEAFVPTDQDNDRNVGKGAEAIPSVPEDFNRVALTLQTLLNTEIKGLPIRLDHLKVYIGAIPAESWRQRPYWIIAVENFRIAVLVNNQAWNRTFILTYNSDDDLRNLATKTKQELKDEVRKDHIVYDFEFNDPNQFTKEFRECLLKIAEGKGIRKMDKAYFNDAENIRVDLDRFRAEAGLQSIEELNVYSLQKSKNTQCANGEVVRGKTYLHRAGIALGLATNSDAAASKETLILNELKKKIGIKYNEIKIYPLMDKEYFNPETIRKDLEAHRVKLNLDSIEQLTTNNMDTNIVQCENGEEVRGGLYLIRAARALNIATSSDQARKYGAVTLKRLKQAIGFEVGDVNIYPDMDRDYFSEENIRADLEKYRKALGLESLEQLSTANLSSAPKVTCENGESVTGQTYLYRAGFALGFGKTGRQAHSRAREVLDALKKKIGLEVEEVKKYPPMDEAYFTRENIVHDLGEYAKTVSVSVSDLNISKMSRAGIITCNNGEPTHGITYLLRAGKNFGFGKTNDEANKRLGEIMSKLKQMALEKHLLVAGGGFEPPTSGL